MSAENKFRSHAEAHQAGWFSRRHESDAEHRAEQERLRKELSQRRDREALQQAGRKR